MRVCMESGCFYGRSQCTKMKVVKNYVVFQDLDELLQDTGPPCPLVTDKRQLPLA